jgi:S-(hydroxymethyl)glutathione dehydrogenase/alcohol dehydrogenase
MSNEFPYAVEAAVMRAANEPMTIETISLHALGEKDVRVRIDATGVCHSDLSLARGKLAQPTPAVLGHEAAGTVLEVGHGVTKDLVGKRVVLLWITPCGECYYCLHDQRYLCQTGASRGGAPYGIDKDGNGVYPGLTVGSFATETIVPVNAVVPIADDLPAEQAALLGCAVSTGIGAVTKAAQVKPGSSVLILGLGGVGLSAILGAKLAGAGMIIAVDRSADKSVRAQAMGAHVFLPADDELKNAIRTLTDKRGVDYAFDCVGSATTIRDAWSLARRGGTACVVGIGGKDETVNFSALELFHFARTLIGSVAGSFDVSTQLSELTDAMGKGDLDLSLLITHRGPLAEINDAFERLETAQAVRSILFPNGQN